MKKLFTTTTFTLFIVFSAIACMRKDNEQPNTAQLSTDTTGFATFPCRHKDFTYKGKTYNVADIYDTRHIYREKVNKDKCFFVISKQEYRLYVYEKVNGDTLLAATYPVCYAIKTGKKTYTNDSCTPECTIQHPFIISQIVDSHKWDHNFGDGRGSFRAYGKWFMRLNLSKSDCDKGCRKNRTIGIHGSTGNEASIPGNDSEGCVRLLDDDIIDLKSRYAQVGTCVTIKPFQTGKYPFEVRAIKQCQGYQQAMKGYKCQAKDQQ